MKPVIGLLALCVTGYHAVSVVVCIVLGKVLFFSKIGLFRLVMSPDKTIKTASSGLSKITHHVIWLILGLLTLAVVAN